MRFAPIAVFAAVLLVAVGFSGCVSKPDEIKNTSIERPETFELSGFESMKGDVCLPESANESVPLFAPVFKNFGCMVSLGWKSDKFNPTEIQSEEKSLFSSKLAVAYWGVNAPDAADPKSNGSAIVVSNYAVALQAGPLASMMNVPILYYGETTEEALWRIGALSFDDIIFAGSNVPASLDGARHLSSFEEVFNETISVAKQKGIDLNYIAVVNPNDSEEMEKYYKESAPHTAYLSCYGSLFAAHRNGIVLTVEANPEKIDAAVYDASMALSSAGMNPKFLLMLGDSISLPFTYFWVPGYDGKESLPGVSILYGTLGQIPTDNVYADLEDPKPNCNQTDSSQGMCDKALTVELANGRIVARELKDLSAHFHRIVRYNEYLTNADAPAQPAPLLGADWNNNALTYTATRAEFGMPEEIEGFVVLYTEGKFNTQDDNIQGHLDAEGLLGTAAIFLAPDFANSNFIIAGADHGSPQGNSVQYDQIVPMPPNVNFQISCLTGQIDNHNDDEGFSVAKKDSATYAMLENGAACYVAAMRSTLGSIPSSSPATGKETSTGSSGEMAYYFFQGLVQNDWSVGEALQFAKASVYASFIPTDESLVRGNNNRVAVMQYEYQLYGDPAFNPYEPCNEGSK